MTQNLIAKNLLSLATEPSFIHFKAFIVQFLVADTRLYTLPCRSVGPSVRPSVTFLFLHYRSCQTVRDCIAVYPALFLARVLILILDVAKPVQRRPPNGLLRWMRANRFGGCKGEGGGALMQSAESRN